MVMTVVMTVVIARGLGLAKVIARRGRVGRSAGAGVLIEGAFCAGGVVAMRLGAPRLAVVAACVAVVAFFLV